MFDAVCANDYAQFDGLIDIMAAPLGREGLCLLKVRFEDLAARPPATPKPDDRKVIGISSRGPIYQDDYDARRYARLVQSASTDIADALGDETASRKGRYSPDWRRVHIHVLNAQGHSDDAQHERWGIVEQSLDAEYRRRT